MSFVLERQLISIHLSDQWALSSKSSLKIKYENKEFMQPENECFLALFIKSGISNQISLGTNPLIRNEGLIDIQIFCPIDDGTLEIREIIDILNTIFSRQTLSDGNTHIVIYDPTLNELGEVNSWYQVNVSYPFRRDEI